MHVSVVRSSRSQGVGAALALALLAACSASSPEPSSARSPGAADASTQPDACDAAAGSGPVCDAARAGLKRFLHAIPADRLEGYGFADRAELDRARLAAPYRVWTADAGGNALAATGEWRVPVTVDGSYRALLTVSQAGGEYRAVDFGAAGLARELAGLERSRGVGADAQRVLLRLYAVGADLTAFPAAGARVEDSKFEPLASARVQPGAPRSAVDAKSLLPWVRERLKATSNIR
jgi:hypothetical protein